jgi:hypothetical protein
VDGQAWFVYILDKIALSLHYVHPAAPKFNRGYESKSAFVCTVLDIPEKVSLNMGGLSYRVDNDNGVGLFSTKKLLQLNISLQKNFCDYFNNRYFVNN